MSEVCSSVKDGLTVVARPVSVVRQTQRLEAVALAFVLTATWHAIPMWLLLEFFPARSWYKQYGSSGYAAIHDILATIVPLLLCLATPARSGFVVGRWKGCGVTVLGICLVPIILTAIIYPLTSKPFQGGPVSLWLISPAAQDLLFTGYFFGLFAERFPGKVRIGISVPYAVLMAAAFFSLWHLPNFQGLPAAYVIFQLLYVFIGGVWTLLARVQTGSIIPGVIVHMTVNFLAWKGW